MKSIFLYPYFFITTLGIFFITIFPLCLIGVWLPKQHQRFNFTRIGWRIYAILILRVAGLCRPTIIDERNGGEGGDEMKNRGLYICNHQSFADIPLVISKVTIPPIMKKSLLYIPIFGICCYAAGSLIVDRKKMNSRKRTLELARKRLKDPRMPGLMIYPEGTRRKDGIYEPKSVEDIKKPILVVAYREGIPVYPMALRGTETVLNKYGVLNPFRRVALKINDGVYPQDYSDSSKFIEACWNKVIESHKELEKFSSTLS